MSELSDKNKSTVHVPFEGHMKSALAEAKAAMKRGEVPVGAAIADSNGKLVATAGNRMRELSDPTAHAEILVIRQACAAKFSERLHGFRIYVTLEPCPMCATAISLARIDRLYYAVSDPKSGGVESGARIFEQKQCNHRPEIYSGIAEQESRKLLQEFFQKLRNSS